MERLNSPELVKKMTVTTRNGNLLEVQEEAKVIYNWQDAVNDGEIEIMVWNGDKSLQHMVGLK